MIPRGRAPGDLLLFSALALISLAAAPQSSSISAFHDLVADLAARIAAAAPLDRVHLVPRDTDRPAAEAASLERELGRELASLGVTIVAESGSAATVTYTCAENIRSRICAAEIQTGAKRHSVLAERWKDSRSSDAVSAAAVLSLQPVFAQSAPILDVELRGVRSLVLDPSAVSVYERGSAEAWHLIASRPVSASTPWPRDVRGRLRVDGNSIDAFLPGTLCRGTLDPFAIACSAGQRSWPVGFDNSGIAAGTNVFTDPNGLSFYSAGVLDPATPARRLIAGPDGVALLDASGRPMPVTDQRLARATDVVSLTTPCVPGAPVVVVASRMAAIAVDGRTAQAQQGDDGADALRVFSVGANGFAAQTPPAFVRGSVTALWPAADPGRVLVVSHNRFTGAYEAFHANVSCGR